MTQSKSFPTTVEEQRKSHCLTVKELKELIENLDDDMLVVTHRIEDAYFTKYGENGWKCIKTLWETLNLSETQKNEYLELLNNKKADQTLFDLSINPDGSTSCNEYIDAIPAFQAFVTKEKGDKGQKVLLITPHY